MLGQSHCYLAINSTFWEQICIGVCISIHKQALINAQKLDFY